MAFLYVPCLLAWIVFVVKEGSIHHLWLVLGSHIWMALVPYLAIILNEVVGLIDEKETLLGANSLMLTISISPILVLLMLNTGPPREKHRELLKKLSATIGLEMFDVIEILELIMVKKQAVEGVGIPEEFKTAVGVLACVSLISSPLELMEISVEDSGKIHTLKAPFATRFVLQIVISNCAFFAVRLVLWLNFKEEASIFLVKNVLKIITSSLEVCIVFKICGCRDVDE